MTIKEFRSINWGPGMRAIHRDHPNKDYLIGVVDFQDNTVGLIGFSNDADQHSLVWVSIEDITLVYNNL